MFDPKHPRGVYPGPAAVKSQYVLITENGEERTSNVSTERIYKAVYEIEANGYVTLEKCQPVMLDGDASVFAICYYEDSRVAVYFNVGKSVMRMCRAGHTCDAVADMMCDFFESAKVPDMHGWTCEELKAAPQKHGAGLTVDGEDFRYFDFADVMAALENIRDGKSKWLQHDLRDDDSGYIHIRRCEDDAGERTYKVEWVKWTTPDPIGFRTETADYESVRTWLWNFALSRKYPAPSCEWTAFDVNDYFQRLLFRFLDNDER